MNAPQTKAPAGREQRILEIIETARSKRPRFKDERITMAHGAGGKATQTLIEGLLAPAFASETLDQLADAGAVTIEGLGLALTTDTYVVRPLRFPGGSIGELAVNGTVNDLAAAGARALAISLALVLEEGLEADVLRGEVEAIAETARAAGVEVVTGDTKVVERGDRVLVSRTIGEHGTAIMLARGELGLDAEVESDTRSLWPVAEALISAAGQELKTMRDATRGGVATVLNELARASGVGISVAEAEIPVRADVAGACELLGIDPMYVANEGVMVAVVAPGRAEAALEALRSVPGCEAAKEIAEVRAEPPGMVLVETAFGGRRVMDLLAGDPLPRIC